MDFLQSNLTGSLFIAVLYPVDLILTTPSPPSLFHLHSQISSSEFKMHCWLIKGVLIECSESGTPLPNSHSYTHTHARIYAGTHMQSQRQHGVHQGRRAWGISCQSKMERKASAHPPGEMGFSRSYLGLVQLSQPLLSKPRYLFLTAGEYNSAQIASLTVCLVLMRGGI